MTAARRRVVQYLSLVAANAGAALVNLVIVLVLTQALTPTTFGEYRYTVVFFAFIATVAQLGIPYAASVLLTRMDDPHRQRQLITVTVTVMIGVSVVVSLVVLALVLAAGQAGVRLNRVLLWAAPFLLVGVLQAAWVEILKGANRVYDIAAQTLGPYLLILGGAAAAWGILGRGYSYGVILAIHVLAYALTHVLTLARFWSAPGPEGRELAGELRRAEREMGVHVYAGSVFAVAITNLLSLVVGHVVGMDVYASYALALSMSLPIQMIPAVMGMVMFRDNARAVRLSTRSISGTLVMTAAFLGVFLLALWLLFPLLFPPSYQAAARFCWVLCPAYAVFGVGDFFNRFVGAKGNARYLKWGAAASGTANLAVTLSLLPALGVWAAVLGAAAAACVYAAAMTWAYGKTVREGTNRAPGAGPIRPAGVEERTHDC